MHNNRRRGVIGAIALTILLAAGIAATLVIRGVQTETADHAEEVIVKDTIYKYGLPIEEYVVTNDTVRPRQTLAELLMGYGLTASKVYALTQCPDTVFDVRKVRAGQP